MFATIAVEAPGRAAAALAELTGGRAGRPPGANHCLVIATGLRIALAPAAPAPNGRPVLVLPLETPLAVERVIESACAHGFHAEEIRRGVLEFWIDEFAALEVATPEAEGLKAPLMLAA